jgi:hypothetical protein
MDNNDGTPFKLVVTPVSKSPIPGTPSVDSCLAVDSTFPQFSAISAKASFYGDPADDAPTLQRGLKKTHYHVMNNKFYFPSQDGGSGYLYIYYHLHGGVPLLDDSGKHYFQAASGIIPLKQIDKSITNKKIILTVLLCFRKCNAYDVGKIVAKHLLGQDLVLPIYKDRLVMVLFDDAGAHLPTDVLMAIADQML